MEKRKFKRISASSDASGQMLFASDLDIKDLSMSGIRFFCSGRVVPESSIQLVIKIKNLQMKLAGKVVRSTLRNNVLRKGKVVNLYEVAISFKNLNEKERTGLGRIIEAVEGRE
jgi:hypothetical protein